MCTEWALSWFLESGVWLDWVGRILIGSCPKCSGEELAGKRKVAACGEAFTGNEVHEHWTFVAVSDGGGKISSLMMYWLYNSIYQIFLSHILPIMHELGSSVTNMCHRYHQHWCFSQINDTHYLLKQQCLSTQAHCRGDRLARKRKHVLSKRPPRPTKESKVNRSP